jgi:hypothetical protein
VQRVYRKFDEIRLSGAVFFDVAKAFETVWISGILYKLKILNLPTYLVKTISTHPTSHTFDASFHPATYTNRCIPVGIAQGGIISPVWVSMYVNEMPSSFGHV